MCGPAGRWSQRRSGGGRGPYQAAEGRKADGRDGAGRRERGERRAGRWGRTGRRGFLLLFLLMRVFSAAGNFAVFLKETSARRREVVLPGDGYRRESGGVLVARYPPEKSALGEGEGARGRGNTLSWRERVFPLPRKEPAPISAVPGRFVRLHGPARRLFRTIAGPCRSPATRRSRTHTCSPVRAGRPYCPERRLFHTICGLF